MPKQNRVWLIRTRFPLIAKIKCYTKVAHRVWRSDFMWFPHWKNHMCLAGWWLTYPSEKWWSSSMGRMTSHIWNIENKTYLKPPTSCVFGVFLCIFHRTSPTFYQGTGPVSCPSWRPTPARCDSCPGIGILEAEQMGIVPETDGDCTWLNHEIRFIMVKPSIQSDWFAENLKGTEPLLFDTNGVGPSIQILDFSPVTASDVAIAIWVTDVSFHIDSHHFSRPRIIYHIYLLQKGSVDRKRWRNGLPLRQSGKRCLHLIGQLPVVLRCPTLLRLRSRPGQSPHAMTGGPQAT